MSTAVPVALAKWTNIAALSRNCVTEPGLLSTASATMV